MRLMTRESTTIAQRRGPRAAYSPLPANRAPIAMSLWSSAAISSGTSAGSCWPSASSCTTVRYPSDLA